jgi:hypothetical protein
MLVIAITINISKERNRTDIRTIKQVEIGPTMTRKGRKKRWRQKRQLKNERG